MLPTTPPAFLRHLAAALLLVAAGGALAASADATDDAFGALLAMPGAQPKEGGWIIPQEPAANEAALIAQWRRLKKQGADVDALRHGGTLLAHAIRTGKDQAAIWLLHNGADPHKTLFGQPVDAYALARKHGRTAVVAVLEREYGFKPPRPVVAARPAASTPSHMPSDVERSLALMSALGAPYGRPDAPAQQAWRRYAATLSDAQFRALFKDGDNIELLVTLTRTTDGGMEEAFARLPVEVVRHKATAIASLLQELSFLPVKGDESPIGTSARSWPALWRRLDKPLDYGAWPDLAGRIPADLWPALFASGYTNRDAEATTCQLAAVDLHGLKALWPTYLREFPNARDEAAGLVLAPWRLDRYSQPCGSSQSAAETAAKLAWLREQGVTAPAYGVRRPADDDEHATPELLAMIDAFAPKAPVEPRLVRVAPTCTPNLDDRWWTPLAKVRIVGWGIPADAVQAIDVPGQTQCGLFVSGDQLPESPRDSDSFDQGPFRDPPTPRCADTPDDGEVWVAGQGGVLRPGASSSRGDQIAGPQTVRDRVTGKRYVLDNGRGGAACQGFIQLPHAFEWRTAAAGAVLRPSGDALLIARLLRQQCRAEEEGSNGEVTCPGLEPRSWFSGPERPPLERLGVGDPVRLHDLLDALGSQRRAAYHDAIVAHDNAALRRLTNDGVPPWWTAAEIESLAEADLPVEEKRRRIALLFADADQLAAAFHADSSGLPDSLAPWLPRQDWSPILRMVAKAPGVWSDMAGHVRASLPEAIGCDLDRAQQFVCGGGIKPD